MSFELSDLVESRNRVNDLLCNVSERWIEEATESGTLFSDGGGDGGGNGGGHESDYGRALGGPRRFSSSFAGSFLFPLDLMKLQCDAAGLPPQSVPQVDPTDAPTEGVPEEPTTWIKTMHQLQTATLLLSNLDSRAPKGRGVRRVMAHFSNARLPPSVPVCPRWVTN